MYLMIADTFRIGINAGITVTFERRDVDGRAITCKQVVSNMLQFGKSPQEIHDECQIPLDLIEKVQKEILEKV